MGECACGLLQLARALRARALQRSSYGTQFPSSARPLDHKIHLWYGVAPADPVN